jgi:hypothetical protein
MKYISILILFLSIYNLSFSQQTKISYQSFGGLEDPKVKAKLDSAVNILEEVINSSAFANEIRHTKFLRKRHNSNDQILNLIKSGQEEETTADNVINLKLIVYDGLKNEVGHTDERGTIHTRKGYILENPASCYAAQLLHEYCHVLGFRHAFLRMPFRYISVPYRVGKILSKLKYSFCP